MVEMFVGCCILILLDILCGVTAAARSRALDSSIMRDGLYNKVGELLLLSTATIVEFGLDIPPFDQLGIPPEVMGAVCAYIAVMELLSIIENICKINPELPFAKILYIFNLDDEGDDDVESKRASGE